ncbi:MAG: hypothetical protein ACE5J9_00440 [Methanosarcinales archaeon]
MTPLFYFIRSRIETQPEEIQKHGLCQADGAKSTFWEQIEEMLHLSGYLPEELGNEELD